MDDAVKKYLQDKYQEQLGDLNAAQAFANLGDVIAGRSVGSQNPYYSEQRKLAESTTLDQIKQDEDRQLKAAQLKEALDLKLQQMAQTQQQNQANLELRKQGLQQSKELSQGQQDIHKMMIQSKLDEQKQKKLEEQSLEGKLKKLSGNDKARFDNALMVLKGIDDMGAALDQGQNTFSVIGDNDYTAAERRATEAYGRMQSGGAINREEESRFSKTLPQSSDPKEMQRSKLLKQRDEMLSRLKTLGFKPEDIGYQPKEFGYGKKEQKTITRKLYSPSQNKTKLIYSDGTEEVLDGQQ